MRVILVKSDPKNNLHDTKFLFFVHANECRSLVFQSFCCRCALPEQSVEGESGDRQTRDRGETPAMASSGWLKYGALGLLVCGLGLLAVHAQGGIDCKVSEGRNKPLLTIRPTCSHLFEEQQKEGGVFAERQLLK